MTSVNQSTKGVSHRIWWQLAVLVAVSVAAVYVGIRFDEEMTKYLPETNTLASTFNLKPSGLSGLYEIAGRAGLKCRLWQLPYRRLKDVKGMLIVIEPGESPQEFEVDELLAWVASGNKLIYLDSFSYTYGRAILHRLGIDAHESASVADEPVATGAASPEFAHVPTLAVRAETRVDGGNMLVKDASGGLVTVVRHGKGTVLVGSASDLGANRHLAQPAHWPNFQFLVNLMSTADGEIFFDEKCHGHRQSSNVFAYLGRGPLGLVFLQTMIVLALALASAGQRFGSVETIAVGRKISALEFVNGLANTFRRARAADLVWEILDHALRARLCKALGVAPQEGADKLVESWSAATGRPGSELASFLAASEASLAKRHLEDSELITLVQACDKISQQSRELLASGRGRRS